MTNDEFKQELSKLSHDELKARWYGCDSTLWDMEQEADRRGYSTPGEDYMGGDLQEEMDLINRILKERGLPEMKRRPIEDEEDEEDDDLFWAPDGHLRQRFYDDDFEDPCGAPDWAGDVYRANEEQQ